MDEVPPKRRRTVGAVAKETSTSSPPLSERLKHDTMWWNDGDIIIAASHTLFKFYKGVLISNSPVFQDMFSFPQPIDSNPADTMDGLPVICMQDNDEDLAHFLNALCIPSYFSHLQPCSWAKASAILRLSTKYQVQALRDEAIARFSIAYPDNIKALRERKQKKCMVTGEYSSIEFLSLARETDAQRLLPFAHYAVALDIEKLEIEQIYVDLTKIAKEDLLHCIVGGQKIRDRWCDVVGNISAKKFLEDCEYMCGIEIQQSLKNDQFHFIRHNPDVLDFEWRRHYDACKKCDLRMDTEIELARRALWEELPSFFHLPSWAETEALSVSVAS